MSHTLDARRTPVHTPRYSPPAPDARLRALDAIHRAPRLAVGALVIALATFVAHVVANAVTPYGVHRDELLYLAMGRHLRLWAMDFPPGIALVAEGSRALFGESLVALRVVPALAHAAIVLLAALAARAMGGRAMAQGTAALVAAASPLFLRAGNLLQPVVLEQLAWTAALHALLLLGAREVPRRWVALGIAAGFGLLLKLSALYFGAAMAVALLATPMRRSLATRWPWVALALALAIGSPTIAGQVALDFPAVGQVRDLQAAQLSRVTPGAFAFEQLLFGPGTLLALVGAGALLAARWARPWRAVGATAAVAFAILLLLRGKAYYFGPMYPVLFAAGAVALERMRAGRAATAARWGTVAAAVAYGALTLPLGLPLLAPDPMARYAARLGVTEATRTNRGDVLPLPQDYADMLPWEEEVAAVAAAYASLPAAERREVVIVPDNYGQAGAIDFFGPRHGLPPTVMPKGSYWFWGPGTKPGHVILTIGTDPEDLAVYYDSVTVVGTFAGSPYLVEEERDLPILVGRRPKATLQEIWPSFAGKN